MLIITLLSLAQARTWTVDPSGAGDAATIAEGVALLSDGDTLNIAAGTYDVVGVRAWANDIVIQGAGQDRTSFDGSTVSTSSDNPGVWASGENITIKGIRFQNYLGLSTTETAVDLDGTVTVEDCAFIANYIGVRATYAVAPDLSILNTIFADNQVGIYVPNQLDTLHVENSLFVDNAYAGVWQDDVSDYSEFNQIEMVNNSFVGGLVGVQIAGYGGRTEDATQVYLVNNVFSDVQNPWWIYLTASSPTTSGEIRNNVYSLLTTPVLRESAITPTDNLEADPMFVAWTDDGDWTNDDLHLLAGSPGIDAGVEGYASLTTDADGVERTVDGDCDGVARPDAGAYEFTPTAPCADTGTDTGAATDTGPTSNTGDSASDDDDGSSEDTGHSVHTIFGCATAGGPASGLALLLASLLGLRRRQR